MAEDEQWSYRQVPEVPTDGPPLRALMEPYHEDPHLNAVLQEECHNSLAQIDRGRHLNRDENSPLITYILGDIPLPQPVNEHQLFDDAVSWLSVCATTFRLIPDLSFSNGVNQLLMLLMPGYFPNLSTTKKRRAAHRKLSGRTDEELAEAAPMARRLPVHFRREGARYDDHVFVDADSVAAAEVLIRAALPGIELTFPAYQKPTTYENQKKERARRAPSTTAAGPPASRSTLSSGLSCSR